ncbi:sigma-54-dependent Fis family transcriptional regulator [Nocardia nova]|uniref:sigma-54-dependent Fis family transcriptional regulator n=1 Tax=Nocardia nova TaxID=37330 RepID=UPI0033D58F83
MPSTSAHPESRTRPEIAWSLTRSRLNGLTTDVRPRVDPDAVTADSALVRAARPVLESEIGELAGSSVALVLADNNARVVDVHCADRATLRGMTALGVVAGTGLREDEVGTNAVGTPLEMRAGLLIKGSEHFMGTFRNFTCYGQPIFHPITRRLEGVLDIGGRSDDYHLVFEPLVRRMVRDIEERLQHDSSLGQRRLFDAFQTVARRRGRAVVVIGHSLVLATPAALDLLEPVDHAAVRACAEGVGPAGATHQLTLTSGRSVRLRCAPVDGADGVLIDILPTDARRRPEVTGRETGRWPLLIVGENGSGRTTEARLAGGPGAVTLDAAEIVRRGEQSWAAAMTRLLSTGGAAVIIENLQLLSVRMTTLLAQRLRETERPVIMTSTPGPHLDGDHAPLAVLCNDHRELLPLRRRRHEIPRLAQHMLADVADATRTRLAPETLRIFTAQPWPGNLAEMHRVIRAVAETRSAGDIIPSDLPHSYRSSATTGSPLRQAEREVIVAALAATGGNKLKAARELGVSRSTLYNRMRALHIN